MFSGDAIDEPADPGGRLTLSASPRWRARLQRRGQVGRGDSGTSGIGIGAASVGSGGVDDLPPIEVGHTTRMNRQTADATSRFRLQPEA